MAIRDPPVHTEKRKRSIDQYGSYNEHRFNNCLSNHISYEDTTKLWTPHIMLLDALEVVSVMNYRSIVNQIFCVANFFLVRGCLGSFRSLSPHFVVFIHGERDQSISPCLGGAAVQISLKMGECCVADVISSRMTQYWKEPLTKKICNTKYSLFTCRLRDAELLRINCA